MIIDCHCHAGLGDVMTDPWNTDAPLKIHLQRAQAAGIHRTIVFAPFHTDYAVANENVGRIVRTHPDKLIGFAFIHPQRDRGRVFEMVNRAVLHWRFRGIKVHGRDGFPGREICEVAGRFRIPILVDVIGKPHVVEMLASRYPHVDFIIPHLGSFNDDWKAQQTVCDQLVRFPNVYADTSGVRRFDYVVQAVERAGAHKVLFGSDGPWLHPGLELHKIRLLSLASDQEAAVLGGNVRRLLRKFRVPKGIKRRYNIAAIRPQQQAAPHREMEPEIPL